MANPTSKYFGNYPAEYNRAVHGPYDPSRFYGKGKFKVVSITICTYNLFFPADTPLANVKLNELGAWFNRRNLHPGAMVQACSRAYARYLTRYAHPKFASPSVFFFQMITAGSIFFYLLSYPTNLRMFLASIQMLSRLLNCCFVFQATTSNTSTTGEGRQPRFIRCHHGHRMYFQSIR